MKMSVWATALAGAALVAMPALADPLRWTINGTFADGGTVSGSYVYDNDVPGGALTQVNVTTTAGTTLATGATYVANRGAAGSNGLELITAGGTANGQRVMYLSINGNMGNTATTLPLQAGGNTVEGLCSAGSCGGVYGSPRNLTSGSITGVPLAVATPVPTLTEWAMIGFTGALAAAGALMVMRRRRFA